MTIRVLLILVFPHGPPLVGPQRCKGYLDTKITHTTTPGKALIISHFIGQTILSLYTQKNLKIRLYGINDFKEANDTTKGELIKETYLYPRRI